MAELNTNFSSSSASTIAADFVIKFASIATGVRQGTVLSQDVHGIAGKPNAEGKT